MAVEIKVTCDTCGSRVFEGRTLLVPKSGKLRHRPEGFDLCPACASDLLDWFGPLVNPKPGLVASHELPLAGPPVPPTSPH
jgi:hypothetical protein